MARVPGRIVSISVRVGLGLVLLFAGAGVLRLLTSMREAPETRDAAPPPAVVAAMRVDAVDLPRRWSGYGTARAKIDVVVASELAARVVERPARVEAGRSVSAGDLLARLDATDFEARAASLRQSVASVRSELSSLEVEEASIRDQLDILEAELAFSERELERALNAQRAGASNDSSVDARRRDVDRERRSLVELRQRFDLIGPRRAGLLAREQQAAADLRQAEENVARTEIRAAFDGVIQEVFVEAGEYLSPGQSVARVVDLSVIEVPVRLPASATGRIAVGDESEIRGEGAGADETWTGSVARVAPVIDATARSMTVFVEVTQDPSAAGLLSPGAFVLGEVTTRRTEPRLIVPRRVLRDGTLLVARLLPVDDAGPDGATAAEMPAVVREATAFVERYIDGAFPSLAPIETEWAVLEPTRDDGSGRSLRAGDMLVLSNLADLRDGIAAAASLGGLSPGLVVDLRPVVALAGGAGGTAQKDGDR